MKLKIFKKRKTLNNPSIPSQYAEGLTEEQLLYAKEVGSVGMKST